MRRKSILVIDDDPGIRECLSEVFSAVGYDFHAEENGMAGLALLERTQQERWPDLIILDNRMPVMDGLEFLSVLSQRFPKEGKPVPVIFFSATKGMPAYDAGPRWQVHVLEKLTDLEVLLGIVHRLIGPPAHGSLPLEISG